MHRDYVTAVLLLAAIFSIPFQAHAADVPRPLFAAGLSLPEDSAEYSALDLR
jgi:hypothetical protein